MTEDFRLPADYETRREQEWGFESPQTGLMYVTRNVMLFETMLAAAPEGTVPWTRFAPDWVPAPTDPDKH